MYMIDVTTFGAVWKEYETWHFVSNLSYIIYDLYPIVWIIMPDDILKAFWPSALATVLLSVVNSDLQASSHWQCQHNFPGHSKESPTVIET